MNGTRYVGCQSPIESLHLNVSKDEGASGRRWETVKEQNMRLLIMDRANRIATGEIGSLKSQTRRSRHTVKCSKQVEMLSEIKEEHASGRGNGRTSGGGKAATVDDSASDVRR